MNREDIIRMAREAGLVLWEATAYANELKRFAALVASAERERLTDAAMKAAEKAVDVAIALEREACAKVCEDLVPTYLKDGERWLKGRNGKPDSRLKDLAPNLEAAWEAEQLLKHGSVVQKITDAHICANAIRARGQA